MAKKACHSELVSETNKGGESLPLARTSSLATPSSGGHPRNAPVDTQIEASYELPEGWKWCRLGDVCKTFADGDWIESKDQSESGIRLVQTGNIGNGEFRDKEDKYHYISEETFKKLKCTEIFPGDILISRLPEPVGRSCIIPDSNYKMITAVDCTIIRLFENITCKNWFCYYTQSHVYAGLIHERCTGTTRLRISRKNLGEIPFPLPPTLVEQQRIVNRIETMFEKLDQAQEKAQAVLDSFETRKAAILHKAFTGQLTANWRKENDVSDDSWEEKTLCDICSFYNGDRGKNYPSKTEYVSKGIAWINTGHITEDGFLDEYSMNYITKEKFDSLRNGKILKGDFVFCLRGATFGKIARVEPFETGAIASSLVIIRLKTNIEREYVFQYLKSPFAKEQLSKFANGSAQPNLAAKDLAKYSIPVPTIHEQQEIVRILNTVLEKESRAKEAAQNVLDQISLLKKSILARAFRGEM